MLIIVYLQSNVYENDVGHMNAVSQWQASLQLPGMCPLNFLLN